MGVVGSGPSAKQYIESQKICSKILPNVCPICVIFFNATFSTWWVNREYANVGKLPKVMNEIMSISFKAKSLTD